MYLSVILNQIVGAEWRRNIFAQKRVLTFFHTCMFASTKCSLTVEHAKFDRGETNCISELTAPHLKEVRFSPGVLPNVL